jgi:hypothetical protein
MFHPDSHLNKHGFFEVGQEKFYSKLDAIKKSIDTGHEVCWNFNREIFSDLDWTTEPNESIESMYRRRAQHIRHSYDYVVVMFSGGADSTTVLQSFVDNDIIPDEIYIQHWLKGQSSGKDGFMTGEIFHAAIPFAEKCVKKFPSIKLNVFDVSDLLVSMLCDPSEIEKSFREVNNVHNLGQPFVHHNLPYRFDHWKTLYQQGKRIAFVWGEAKPHVDYDETSNRHFFYFEDHYAHCPQPRDQEKNDPLVHHEQFFDDPGFPEIKVKQCHLLLNTLRQIRHRSDIFVLANDTHSKNYKNIKGPLGFEIQHPRGSLVTTVYEGKKYVLDRNALNCSIYPRWNFLTYHQDKQAGRVYHPAHSWLQKNYPVESKKWYSQFLLSYGSLPDYWTKYYGNLSFGIQRLKNIYYIE